MDKDWEEAVESNATVSRGTFSNPRDMVGKGNDPIKLHVLSKIQKQRRIGKNTSSKYGNSVRDRLMAPSRPRESLYNISLGYRGNQLQFMIDDANRMIDRSDTKAKVVAGIKRIKSKWRVRDGLTEEEFEENWKKVKDAIRPRTVLFGKKCATSNSTDKVDKWKNAWVPNYVQGALDLEKMDEEKIIPKEEMEADF